MGEVKAKKLVKKLSSMSGKKFAKVDKAVKKEVGKRTAQGKTRKQQGSTSTPQGEADLLPE